MTRNLLTTSFAGSTPRRAEYLAPVGQAVRALDCKLTDGSLQSWRTLRATHTVPDNAKSVYHAFNCCWLTSTKCASWAEGSAEQQHVFATQYNDYDYPVRIILDSECSPAVYRLGLPCPSRQVIAAFSTVSATNVFSKASAPRQYAIQFEDSFGNASQLSPPSDVLVVEDGTAVVVSGWELPAGNWDIKKIRILRTTAGYESPLKEGENKVDAAWMLVGAVDAGKYSFIDDIHDYDLPFAIAEDSVPPPPSNLRGITWIRSMNCLVGFAGRELWFSENNFYHSWPHKLLLDDTIKAICESNGTIYVATDGAPYSVVGVSDCENAGCRKAVRMPESLPLVGSGYRSMVATPSGCVYPTHNGMVYITGNRAPLMLSATHYAGDDWHALHPDTMKAAYHEGRLFAFFRRGAFCLGFKDGASNAGDTEHHSELSMRPDEVLVTRSGRLYLRFGGDMMEWDRGDALLPHEYVASDTITGVPFNFGALQVMMEPGTETVELFVDDESVLLETLNTSDYFTLPRWAVGQIFRWVLRGTARVKQVCLAPSVKEL